MAKTQDDLSKVVLRLGNNGYLPSQAGCYSLQLHPIKAVSTRAAHLSAAGIAALLHRINIRRVTIGVDGSLFKFHSRFHDELKRKIGQLMQGSQVEVELVLADDGNSRGAALVAAAAVHGN